MTEKNQLQEKLLQSALHIAPGARVSNTSDTEDQAQKELTQLRVDLTTIKQENMVLKHKADKLQGNLDQFKNLKTENLDLKSKAENLGKQLIAYMTSNSTNAIELEKLKLDNNFLKQNLEALKAQLGITHSDAVTVNQELEKAREELLKLMKQKDEAQSKKKEADELAKKLSEATDELWDLKARHGATEAENDRLKRQSAIQQEEIESLKKKALGSNRNITTINQERDQLKLQLTVLREEANEAKLRVKTLESLLADKERDFDALAAENDRITKELEIVRDSSLSPEQKSERSIIESDRKNLSIIQNLEEQLLLMRATDANHSHQMSLMQSENTALQAEIKRLTNEVEQLLADKEKVSSDFKKHTDVTVKLLEEQVSVLQDENKRLQEERNKAVIDSERTKQAEIKYKELHSEVHLIKSRNEYLETELTQKVKELAACRNSSDDIIDKLRDELKYLKEKEARSKDNGVINAGLSPLMAAKMGSPKPSNEGVDEAMTKEKLKLEINLAKLERENRDKEAKITSLESRLGDVIRELEKVKLLRKSQQENSQEQELKQENAKLKEEINHMRDRESLLLAQDEQKEKLIVHLQHAVKEQMHNTSIRNE